MDDTSVDFSGSVLSEASKIGINLSVNDLHCYDLKSYGIDNSLWIKEGFFNNLKFYPNAVKVLCRLSLYHNIIIATYDMDSDIIRKDKKKFIRDNLSFVSKVYFTNEKHKVVGDLIFDDCPDHLESYPGITVKADKPYNRQVKTDYVIYNNDWLSFEELVGNISLGRIFSLDGGALSQ